MRDDGTECATGEIGEITFRSPTVMTGYWNKSTLTAESLRDGWLHTQDLGFVDDGGLCLCRRPQEGHDHFRRREHLFLGSRGSAARASGRRRVAVIAVPDQQWGEAVKACVSCGRDVRAARGVDRACPRAIASYKKPRSIDFVESLPRLFNGKIDKKALRAPYWQGSGRQVS